MEKDLVYKCEPCVPKDKDPLHLEISSFVHFMVQILFHKSNDNGVSFMIVIVSKIVREFSAYSSSTWNSA
jgi:hypothetical protein